MKFIKRKKYSILLNILRYSFILILGIGILFPVIFTKVNAASTTPSSMSGVTFKGLVPVCNTILNTDGGFEDPCDFNYLMALINKFINFLVITLATPLFALIIIYVGWLYLSDMGNSENITKAKKILKNALIGYVIALAAWLIVKTILLAVGFNPKDAYLEV